MSNQDRAEGVARNFDFDEWTESPLVLFDAARWNECLHATIQAFNVNKDPAATQSACMDTGLLHELSHLACGVDIWTHTSLTELRERLERLTTPQAPGADTPGGRDGEVVIDEGLARDLIDHAEKGKVAEPWMVKQLLEARPAESSGGDAVDAARYRFLRDSGYEISWNSHVTYSPGYAGDAQMMEQAIDRAIAAIASGAKCG